MKRALLFLLSMIMLWSCSSSIPDWYKNREDYYPQKDYIVSEGWGNTPEKAVEKAVISMAQIFNTKVSVEKNILERYESLSDMKDFDEYFYEFSEETAKLITEQNLVNILFVEPVYDRKSKSYFTLGYMKRSETAKILMDRIKREQDAIEYDVRMAYSTLDPLMTYHYFAKAWLSSAKSRMMQEQLDVLMPGLGTTPIYTYAELEAQKDKAAKAIKFDIMVHGDANGRIKQALKTAVNAAGFSVSESDAVVDINAKTLIRDIDIDQDKLSFVSWELQLTMDTPKNGTALSLMKEGREGSTNRDNARLHAYESMQKHIEKVFKDKLINYFDTLQK